MKLFSLDSPFHKYGTIVFDMVVLNVLWFFTSIMTLGLLFPLGTAALFHSINKVIICEDGYMMQTYFSVIKTKFLRSLGLTLVTIVLYGIAILNIWSVYSGFIDFIYLLPVYLFVLFEIVITLLFAYVLLGETDMKIKQLLKYGFLLSNKHLLTSLLSVIIILGTAYLIYYTNLLPIIFLVSPAIWLMAQLIHKRVLSKYYLEKLL